MRRSGRSAGAQGAQCGFHGEMTIVKMGIDDSLKKLSHLSYLRCSQATMVLHLLTWILVVKMSESESKWRINDSRKKNSHFEPNNPHIVGARDLF